MNNANLGRFRKIHGGMTRTQLQDEFSAALRFYLQIAQEGCVLLGNIKEGPLSEYTRNEIFLHRREELWAYARYTRARRQLLNFLTASKPHEKGDNVTATSEIEKRM